MNHTTMRKVIPAIALPFLLSCDSKDLVYGQPGDDWQSKTWDEWHIELKTPPGWEVTQSEQVDFIVLNFIKPSQTGPQRVLGIFFGRYPEFPGTGEFKARSNSRQMVSIGPHKAEVYTKRHLNGSHTSEGIIHLGEHGAITLAHYWYLKLDDENRKQVGTLLASIRMR